MFVHGSRSWAQQVFGRCDLGDRRRTARLIDYARRQAQRPRASVSGACRGQSHAAEGAYRLLRNPEVKAEAIAQGHYGETVKRCTGRPVLAIQDTTEVNAAAHQLAASLSQQGQGHGVLVHSTLMVEPSRGVLITVCEQIPLGGLRRLSCGQQSYAERQP